MTHRSEDLRVDVVTDREMALACVEMMIEDADDLCSFPEALIGKVT